MHSLISDSISLQIGALQNMQHQLTTTQSDVLMDLIQRQTGQIIFSGIGKSGHIAKKITSSIKSLGINATFLHASEAMHGDIGPLNNNDLVFLISNSGETAEILALQCQLKCRHIPMISLTRSHTNSVAIQADLNLIAGSITEADPYSILPTSSTTCALVMGDAITIAIAHYHAFSKTIFAKNHPHGNLGLNALKPLKTQLQSVPIIDQNTPLQQVLSQLLSGHQGCVLVGEQQRLQGLITEGDLNRAISHNPHHWQNIPAKEIMSTSPIILDEQHTVHDAEQVMQQHNINTIVITYHNNDQHILGVYTRIYRKKI
ncbi:KpsF/GutQ family sugar-phosphate isomerase [Photobacterium toruni]|uniref:KpsF/GutQ family sugar-phosphate isomerase n=1 Tax=Photobacterium toruni TaxID=1935446 RepID=UPI0021104CEE|nr:KpsF/GutQ family sugar-phosphate isomerase [Photobacterium toruni]MEC6815241.1 KpsF/GutQ family sugar-phosphate isomerase [Photobacterium toruni]